MPGGFFIGISVFWGLHSLTLLEMKTTAPGSFHTYSMRRSGPRGFIWSRQFVISWVRFMANSRSAGRAQRLSSVDARECACWRRALSGSLTSVIS